MGKIVVVHHAHHKDENLYRVVFAEEVRGTVVRAEPNPDFDADEEVNDENPRLVVHQEEVVEHVGHQEIVWAADDKQWKGKKKADIAAEQRQIASDAITALVARAEREATEREANVSHFDTGHEL